MKRISRCRHEQKNGRSYSNDKISMILIKKVFIIGKRHLLVGEKASTWEKMNMNNEKLTIILVTKALELKWST